MPKPFSPSKEASEPYEDSPIAWFVEMVTAWGQGDIDRAAEAKRVLARLGWSVQYRKPRPDAGKGVDR